MENKVKYGLKNVYYAVLTEGETDTYDTPVRIPGAVNLSLSATGDTSTFVADDVEYYMSTTNNGYDGTLEIATLPKSFEQDVLGETEDAKGVAFENANAEPKYFALLFEFSGDQHQVRHCLYKCLATRANIEGSATTRKEVKPTTLNLMVRPNGEGYVKAKTNENTDQTVYDSWFTSVHTYDEVAG